MSKAKDIKDNANAAYQSYLDGNKTVQEAIATQNMALIELTFMLVEQAEKKDDNEDN